MNHWQPTDEIVYRLPTDPPHTWRQAGTLADLEREHALNQRRINLAQLVELLIDHIEYSTLERMEFAR